MTKTHLLLIGAGQLGRALLTGWLKKKLDLQVTILEPTPSATLLDLVDPFEDLIKINPTSRFQADVVVLAVKPQVMETALHNLKPMLPPHALVISVAAGKTLQSFEKALNDRQPIIRSIPNTPASIGEAMTVAIANQNVTQIQKQMAEKLLSAIGAFAWVEEEAQMDAVTAVSGSGPAYVFLLVEALREAALAAGLPDDLAKKIARQTVSGAGMLLSATPFSPEDLRKAVTSPGGTTEAALKVLMHDDGLASLMTRAIEAAQKRSQELA